MVAGSGCFILVMRDLFEDNGLTESAAVESPIFTVPQGRVVAWFTSAALAHRFLAEVGVKEQLIVTRLKRRELVEWLEGMEAEGVEFVSIDTQVVRGEARFGLFPIAKVLPILKRALAGTDG
jgi:hypothetical protein